MNKETMTDRREFSKGLLAVGAATLLENTGLAGQREQQPEIRERALEPKIEITTNPSEVEIKFKAILEQIQKSLKNLAEKDKPSENLLPNENSMGDNQTIISYTEQNPDGSEAKDKKTNTAQVEALVARNGDMYIYGHDFLPAGKGAKSGFALKLSGKTLNVEHFFEKYLTPDQLYDKKSLNPEDYESQYRTLLVYATETLGLIKAEAEKGAENSNLKQLVKKYEQLVRMASNLKFASGKPVYRNK